MAQGFGQDRASLKAVLDEPTRWLRQRVAEVARQGNPAECSLENGAKVLLPRFLADHLAAGDELRFVLPTAAPNAGAEIHVVKHSSSRHLQELYLVPIGHVSPRPSRGQP